MRLASLRIQNFRSFKDETISFAPYTPLLGPNGSGKSNVLRALSVFFRDGQSVGLDPAGLTDEDFHNRNTDEPVRITVTFTDLSQEALHDFAHYCRQGSLIVSAIAEFRPDSGSAEVKQYGQRLGNEWFAPFFEADGRGAKEPELQPIYEDIRTRFPALPSFKRKSEMTRSLREYEDAHPGECTPIPSQDQFYGVSRGKNLLERYVQWVYVPAVKEVSAEDREGSNTALGKLLQRTVRAKVSFEAAISRLRSVAQEGYDELLGGQEGALKEVSQALSARVREWAHPGASVRLEWAQGRDGAVTIAEPFARAIASEGDFEGALARFGHGFQRAYLLALLQELSESGPDTGPTLVLACEEPELYQHPPQARHLYDVLSSLSKQNAQVVVSTHSPYFVSGQQFESIRLIRKAAGVSVVRSATACQVTEQIRECGRKPAPAPSGTLAKIDQALQPVLSEMFFAPNVIFVEGLEDLAYIATYMALLDLWEEYRRLGCHIVPVQGKSEMIQALAIAKCLRVPAFAVFDADGHKEDKSGSRAQHERDNLALLALAGAPNPDAFPTSTLWRECCVMWHSEIGDVVEQDIGQEEWQRFRDEADTEFGCTGGLRKNTRHIARSLQLAWPGGSRSASLKKLCQAIIEFARKSPDDRSLA